MDYQKAREFEGKMVQFRTEKGQWRIGRVVKVATDKIQIEELLANSHIDGSSEGFAFPWGWGQVHHHSENHCECKDHFEHHCNCEHHREHHCKCRHHREHHCRCRHHCGHPWWGRSWVAEVAFDITGIDLACLPFWFW